MNNDLTKLLYSKGFTRDNYPDNVYWGDWQNFCYKWEYLISLTWETPCGLFIKGESEYGRRLGICDTSYDGIWYCPENDNPLILCPKRNKECPYLIKRLNQCSCHRTDRIYDYDLSLEKIEASNSAKLRDNWIKLTGGVNCFCLGISDGIKYKANYDVSVCIRDNCKNEVCVITKKERNLEKVNIYYDIRRTWITRSGLIDDTKIKIEKGVRLFPKGIARTDAEIWLKLYAKDYSIFQNKQTREDRSMDFFSKHHRTYPRYDYFEFHYDVENIRICKRDSRDLEQDLRDISEGIEVVHASDLEKAAKNDKKKELELRRESKKKKLRKQVKGCTANKTVEQISFF